MKRWTTFATALALGCNSAPPPELSSGAPVTVYRNGIVYSRSDAEPVAAMAVADGEVAFLGGEEDLTRWLAHRSVGSTVDLRGRAVLPGFIDGHVHPLSAGVEMHELNLVGLETPAEVYAAISSYAKAHPDLPWIVGNTWELTVFPEANPSVEVLDGLVPERPAYLSAADGHSAWVNSAALELAGISSETPDPRRGRIERDAKGKPSGTLREDAMFLVRKHAPTLSQEAQVDALADALDEMHRRGVTGFLDASVREAQLEIYAALEARGGLPGPVHLALYADPETIGSVADQVQDFVRLRERFESSKLQIGTVKIFMDGVIEAATAAMLEPYSGAKKEGVGTLNWPMDLLQPLAKAADEAGFQLHFHAIGDRAIRTSLDVVEWLDDVNGPRDRRAVISHSQLVDPADIPRFAALGVVANFQPLWAYEDGYITDLTVPRLGPERSRWIYPIASTAKAGARLAFGSDWSVSSVDPLLGIEAAVLRVDPRQPPNAKPVFVPQERLKRHAAFEAYTAGSAYSLFEESRVGVLDVGFSADFVVFDRDPFEVPAEEISELNVWRTVVGGAPVYEASRAN